MPTEAQLIGISPYVWRLAAHYACLGVGTYQPAGYAFDRVEVLVRMPWQPDEQEPMRSMCVLAVEFYAGKHRQRFVEFALTPAGFGGDPIIKLVEPK
jgi:hypothetical protein